MHTRSVWLAAALIATSLPAQAGTLKTIPLELWINGVSTHRTLLVQMRDATFVVAREDLLAEGFVITSAEAQVTIGVRTEIRATLDEANQRLMVNAPAKDLKPKVFDLRPAAAPPADPSPIGFTLNYDLSTGASDVSNPVHNGTAGLASSMSFFSPYGALLTSGFGRVTDNGSAGARLDSTFVVDDPDRALRLSVGDAISGSLPWSRSVRFAGFQIATDYTLRPDLVTMPLPQFFGDTAVPASVDVFVGATRVFETDVDAGPFELRNLPVLTGGGDVTIHVNDILGRQTSQTLSLYDTTELLAPGLSQYSLEAGFLRRGYGVESFDYNAAVASGTFRQGITPTLSVQTHSELSQALQMAGAGIILALEPFAIVDIDTAASTQNGRFGNLVSAGFHSQWDRFTAFGSYTSSSGGFADLASIGTTSMERRRLQLGLSGSWRDFGSASLSNIDQTEADGTSSHIVAGSYSFDLTEHFIILTGFYDRHTSRWYASAALNILLGNRNTATASGSLSNAATTATLSYSHDGDPDGGVGYRASASFGQNAGFDAQGVWYGNDLSANAEVSSADGIVGARAGVDGSLIMLDGHLFASRQSDGAVALVKTGLPGIPVYQENRAVAVTDENGEALVPDLVPFAANQIGVNPNDFPIATVVENNERVVAPRRRGAVIVDLTPRTHHPVLAMVRLESGLFPPVGAHATLGDSGQNVAVGRGGKIFIDDLHEETDVSIDLFTGRCSFHVLPPAKSNGHIPKLGPYVCVGAPLNAS